MRLWRISEWQDLSGAGAAAFPGRWNRNDEAVVYLADSSALSILEVLVHQPRNATPQPFQLLEIDVPDDLSVTSAEGTFVASDEEASKAWGSAFVSKVATPLARVPSAVAPLSWNYLLNPRHPHARRVTIASASRWPWDARLFGRG